ncbi:MAG: RNA polymerase sigma factor [Armatimonadota bacterium]
MNQTTLVQAVEAARQGDQRAFEALFRDHKDAVYSMALHFARDPEVAADVTQEVFVRAWERLPRLREPAAFGGWLRAMALNLVRDHFRRSHDADSVDEVGPVADRGDGPSALVEQAERDRAVRQAVLALPEHQRVVVAMHHLEGMSVNDIAASLDVPKGTVVSRLARGRNALRTRLAPYIDEVRER